ncbi:gamma-glutamyl-gamma-aminobutyrate hydrolase family protein [Streptomyces sp. NPDC088766]|uniref:gamma-glutamyl-gamma-aminobutyrate hydrolase family protein n=1 Tax=Streptomyces sp. NPDC088766 TaxID=3365893 RepID=UPI0037F30920
MTSASNKPGRRPVIGITGRSVPVTLQGTDMVVSLALQSHVDFLAAAGCLPVVLPLGPGVEEAVAGLDGLLVPGGPDVDPALYGQSRHPRTRGGSADMDRAELAVLGAALGAGLPLLAICRGMQLLNVQCGGTLHQHLPEITGDDTHRPDGAAFVFGRHVLELGAGSRIASVLGSDDPPKTACHHHQAVDRIGTGLTATAWAPDGVVEAVEAVGHPFAVGVQWEAGQTEDDRLHVALAQAARSR